MEITETPEDWTCNKQGCDRARLVTIRIESDEGPKYFALCREHMRDGAAILTMLADEVLSGALDCDEPDMEPQ